MSSSPLQCSKSSYAVMISKAIEIASKLGIQMYHPFLNSANGKCAFEGVIDNINWRPCFDKTYSGSPDYYRALWMNEIENIAFDDWNMGLSRTEWHKEWTLMKNSRTYENCLGDLIIPGIAHAVRKNILIFNTFPPVPAYIVPASIFGSVATTDIPVCLAYNKYHYEQLVPKTTLNVQMTIDLSIKLLAGSSIDGICLASRKEKQDLSEYDKSFPPLALPKENDLAKEMTKNQMSNHCLMTLTELKKKSC